MSTRAMILVKDKDRRGLWFYRHSDGYPSGVADSLDKFLGLVKEGKIRDNTSQASGWLIIIGHDEYGYRKDDWKVGAYEPIDMPDEDVEYFYTIDLEKRSITVDDEEGQTKWEDLRCPSCGEIRDSREEVEECCEETEEKPIPEKQEGEFDPFEEAIRKEKEE